MEEIIIKPKKRLLKFRNLVIFLIAIIVLVFVTDIIATIYQKNHILKTYGIEGVTGNNNRSLYSEETIELLRKKSYLSGRIELSKTDSITLVVSLADSVLRLELKGVIIHRAPIIEVTKSRLFESTDQFAISNLLSTPGTVTRYAGTLAKEPIMLKLAPKDTIEASKPDIAPDTTIVEPVYYTMFLDNGVKLSVSEDLSSGKRGRVTGILFRTGERMSEIGRNTLFLITGRKPEHHMFIDVKVDARDGRIIYRALPHTARVTVRL